MYRFIGDGHGLGLEKGKIYPIKTKLGKHNGNMMILVYLSNWDGNYCPYQSVDSFLENWEKVK